MSAYVKEKATPLKAREAINGSPSPWSVLATTARQAAVSERREYASVWEREESVEDTMVGYAVWPAFRGRRLNVFVVC
jgi:hypothetical protein